MYLNELGTYRSLKYIHSGMLGEKTKSRDTVRNWSFKGPLPVGDSTFPENLQSDVKYTNYTPQTQLLTSVVILSVSVSFRMYKNPILCMIEYPKPWDRMVKSLEIQLWNPIFPENFLESIFSTLKSYPRVWKTPEMNVSRRVESL